LEVRLRAERILKEWAARARKKRLQQLPGLIKSGRVDEFVDQMAPLEDYLDDKMWQVILDFACRIVANANKQYPCGIPFPPVNANRDRYPDQVAHLNKLVAHPRLLDRRIAALRVTRRETIWRCVIVSQGPVQASQDFTDNIVFANGSVTAPAVGPLKNCIIICDGNIQADFASSCILIATGKVKLGSTAGGGCVIIENARKALGLIKFYDVRQAGIEVAKSAKGMVVKKVLKGKPFAEAGICRGDCILALDGARVSSPQVFRRLVRRNAMANKKVVFTVERADKQKLKVTVGLKD
jgi:hypothetical protein